MKNAWPRSPKKISAGTVKTTPAATDSPAEPIVWTMLFSRIVEPPKRFSTEIASTAIGIEALTVRPARRPEVHRGGAEDQAEQAPSTIALRVNSAGDWLAGTYGWNAGFAAASRSRGWAWVSHKCEMLAD